MGDVVSDGESLTCPFCTAKIKLGVSSSSVESDSKKIANTSNHSFSAPGAQCIVVPSAPKPCQPSAQTVDPGQSPLSVDGCSALGAGCKWMCAQGGLITVSSSAQSSTVHDGAAGAENYKTPEATSPPLPPDEDEKKRQAMNKEYGDNFEKPVMKDRNDGSLRQREVYKRKDIDWDYKRADGFTNREAAKQKSWSPERMGPNGKPEGIQLHHHKQDKDGPLIELWSSQHRKVEHNAPIPGWRTRHPDEAAKFNNEQRKYWKWRESQLPD